MKIVAFIMCFLFPLSVFADNGKVASIKQDQKAPFTGFLFDPTAFAKCQKLKFFMTHQIEDFLEPPKSVLKLLKIQNPFACGNYIVLG